MSAPTHLLYLHGFRSSPQSFKAQRLAAWMAAHRPEVTWWAPQLPASPRDAMALVAHGTAGWPDKTSAVIGSSLGGFYATAWAQARPGARCVLLNPAVNPARDLAGQVGVHPSWHDPAQTIEVRPEFGDELRALDAGPLAHPKRCLAIIAKGDELLDWREMQAHCAGAHIKLLEGSDHALSDFDDHLEDVLRFLALN
jgi:predicted esterase YcpF (UPF0227 family)